MSMLTSAPSTTVGKYPPGRGEYETIAVTPSDSVDIPLNSQGKTPTHIRVTGAGNVNVDLVGGGTAVLTSLSAGQVVKVGITRVRSTSTTATGITAFY